MISINLSFINRMKNIDLVILAGGKELELRRILPINRSQCLNLITFIF